MKITFFYSEITFLVNYRLRFVDIKCQTDIIKYSKNKIAVFIRIEIKFIIFKVLIVIDRFSDIINKKLINHFNRFHFQLLILLICDRKGEITI